MLRTIQGIGVGGEWGGSVLLSMEWSRTGKHNRGFLASWPQFGVPAGLFLSTIVMLAAAAWSGDQFLTWGWRVPFALSIVLVAIGMWIRLGILETPVFQKLIADNKIERAPIIEVLKKQPKEVCLSALLRMGQQSPFYIFTAFVFSYAVGTLHMSRDFILTAVTVASVVSFFLDPAVRAPLRPHRPEEDVHHRRGALRAVRVPLFRHARAAVPWVVFIAIVLSLIPHDMMYGPQAALIAESFTPRLRYSGSSLGYQFASVIAGGPAPLIATALFAAYHTGYAIAVYLAVCGLISVISTLYMPDYTNKDVSAEYDA